MNFSVSTAPVTLLSQGKVDDLFCKYKRPYEEALVNTPIISLAGFNFLKDDFYKVFSDDSNNIVFLTPIFGKEIIGFFVVLTAHKHKDQNVAMVRFFSSIPSTQFKQFNLQIASKLFGELENFSRQHKVTLYGYVHEQYQPAAFKFYQNVGCVIERDQQEFPEEIGSIYPWPKEHLDGFVCAWLK